MYAMDNHLFAFRIKGNFKGGVFSLESTNALRESIQVVFLGRPDGQRDDRVWHMDGLLRDKECGLRPGECTRLVWWARASSMRMHQLQ